jgi:hypothetical protein
MNRRGARLVYRLGISPDEIVKLWHETASRTQLGPVVNPRGFIEAVKRVKLGSPG